jgi:hypothetical protein
MYISPQILKETYISTDVETDGPIPGPHSMLSFASAAYRIRPDGTRSCVATFAANLETLPDAQGDADTMSFWAKNPEAYAATRSSTLPPDVAMGRYVDWLKQFQRPVFVGYPAGFDFLFVYWYLVKFTGFPTPFSFSALDVKTYVAAMLKSAYRDVSKRTMPRRWFDETATHTHIALDDAIEQGELFCRMLLENLRRDVEVSS